MSEIALPTPRAFVLGNFVQACCWYVGRQPAAGETIEADGFQVEPGGKGLNVAVGLHRLGAQVQTLIGCGQDQAADTLLALLAREGLSTRHVHRLPGPSGWGSGLIGADGHNSIAVYLGANRLLTAMHAEAARQDIEAAQLVYGQFETALPAVEAAFRIAHARGIPTVLIPSPWRAPPPGLRETTHTVMVNQTEVAPLLALTEPLGHAIDGIAGQLAGAMNAFATEWPAARRLILTLGERGALAAEQTEAGRWAFWHAPAPAIDPVDTVGAGDAFASGYLRATLRGEPLPVALVWGNRCGAHVAAQAGVLGALPDARQLATLLGADPPISAPRLPID